MRRSSSARTPPSPAPSPRWRTPRSWRSTAPTSTRFWAGMSRASGGACPPSSRLLLHCRARACWRCSPSQRPSYAVLTLRGRCVWPSPPHLSSPLLLSSPHLTSHIVFRLPPHPLQHPPCHMPCRRQACLAHPPHPALNTSSYSPDFVYLILSGEAHLLCAADEHGASSTGSASKVSFASSTHAPTSTKPTISTDASMNGQMGGGGSRRPSITRCDLPAPHPFHRPPSSTIAQVPYPPFAASRFSGRARAALSLARLRALHRLWHSSRRSMAILPSSQSPPLAQAKCTHPPHDLRPRT